MGASEENIRALQQEIRWLKRELAARPIKKKGGGASAGVYILQIDRGNTLSDGSTLGIKWSSSALTTVPSLYDPTVDTSFVDGIGRATLIINGATQTNKVLVAHYSGNGSPLSIALFQGDIVLSSSSLVTLPLASDATQTVSLYVPYTP